MKNRRTYSRAICSLGLLLMFAPPAKAGEAAALPIYPGATGSPFSGKLQTNRIPMDVMLLETSDSMEQVLEFYRRELKAQGKQVIENAFSPELVYIGYYDVNSESMLLATVMSRSQDTTWIILSQMDPAQLRQPVEAPAWVPVLEGASELVVTNDAGGESSTAVSFKVRGRSIADVRTELLKQARQKGWQEEKDLKVEDGEMLSFNHGGDHYMVQLVTVDEEDPEILVSLIRFGGDSEPRGKEKGDTDDEK